MRGRSIFDECLAEVTRYGAMKPVKTKTTKEARGPLKWWMQKQGMIPTLDKLALNYLAVQATSAASKHLFSTAGLIMTDKRNSLNDVNAENLIFLSPNHTLRKFWDVRASAVGRALQIIRFSCFFIQMSVVQYAAQSK